MSNTIGSSDDFVSFGNSLILNDTGELLTKLSSKNEGIIFIDTETKIVSKVLLS